MKNQYKINKLKRDLSYCKHGGLKYRLEYFFKAFKNALHRFLDFECGIPFHKTDNLTIPELVSTIPQIVLSIYELKPDNMIYFGNNKNEPINKDEFESIKDVKTAPIIIKDKHGHNVVVASNF